MPHISAPASQPTPLRERGQSETVRERGGSDYKQSSDCGDEESKPFMSSDDLEKELYDPKGSKPNATARFMPRFDGIQRHAAAAAAVLTEHTITNTKLPNHMMSHIDGVAAGAYRDTPRRRLCEGNTCSAKSVCRGCCVLTLLVILLLWLWIAVDRLHSDERREQESPIHPVETGVMVDTWSDHPPTLHSSCPLLYTLSAAKAKTYGLSLAEEELQLLGTLMVRICKCVCPFQLPESATQLAGHLPGHRVLRVCDESAGTVAEILRGANVVVDGDGGWYYRWFQRMQDAYKRTSSHYR
ncbi:hypothetical protein JKP88DRAFT_250424 [Tribonema minus]|uniref:Transmembrane protein n=1 Tax=Tribonema minus TaxID=303371 RepID=A0A836C7N5_9STRA|nr:hypothetical protein JKP88DRAFT_250424 [Tribonema minus]